MASLTSQVPILGRKNNFRTLPLGATSVRINRKSILLHLEICSVRVKFIVDTGAAVSTFLGQVIGRIPDSRRPTLRQAKAPESWRSPMRDF